LPAYSRKVHLDDGVAFFARPLLKILIYVCMHFCPTSYNTMPAPHGIPPAREEVLGGGKNEKKEKRERKNKV
jgi:hypothetical protein